jgi:beta-glucanase (GH16 family)
MKVIKIVSVIFCILLIYPVLVTTTIHPGYKLVWSDEFNGTLDETKWEIAETANYSWLQCNTMDNAYTKNGSLVLQIKQGACPNSNPSLPGYNYNTGLVTSKTTWQYGYFEARAKVAKGYTNSAFWLLGQNWTWPPEIDIYETGGYNTGLVTSKTTWRYRYFGARAKLTKGYTWLLGQNWTWPPEIYKNETEGYNTIPSTIYSAYQWSNNGVHKEVNGTYPGGLDYSQDYHIFAVEWTPTYIIYFVDGVERYRVTATSTRPIASIPMQIILSINKGWETMPTTLPQYHYIDYIRVYQ